MFNSTDVDGILYRFGKFQSFDLFVIRLDRQLEFEYCMCEGLRTGVHLEVGDHVFSLLVSNYIISAGVLGLEVSFTRVFTIDAPKYRSI